MTASARTFIRKVQRSDEKEFVGLMRDSIELHEPWISPPHSPALYRFYLQRLARDDHEGFVVCRREDESIVGAINLNNIVRGSFQSASLGYYIGAKYQGNGHMLEGLGLLVNFAFTALGLHRLEANIQPDNSRSIALVTRCGFTKEGLSPRFLFINGAWRDHERWCIVDERLGLRN